MLGGVDLTGWADEGDLVRAEIRLLPIVQRFTSESGVMQKILGHDLSLRLRAFNQGRNLNVDALRRLLADLVLADRSPPPEATIDRISRVDWFDLVPTASIVAGKKYP